MEDNNNNLAKVEALLFANGDPMALEKISGILKIKKDKCRELLDEYKGKLEEEERGLALIEKDGKVQLVTKPELSDTVKKIIEEDFAEEPTPAAMETLAIIAYLGPIPKTDIDFIRGVNSGYTLRNLLIRGIVERKREGHTHEYRVTFDFLKHLGLKSIEELPDYGGYRETLEKYKAGDQ